jgi:anti-anti-sigma factor
MYSRWDGPAAGLIGRNLHRADADTMVFDAVMWQPGPEHEPPALRFQVSGDRHAPVVTASGELTTGSVALLTTPLRHIMRRRPRQVIVDLSGITAATRSGLRALIETREVARTANVDFWLRSPSQPVQDLLHSASARAGRGPARRERHSAAPTPGQPQPQPPSHVAERHDAKDAPHSSATQTADEQPAEGEERRHSRHRHAADTTGHLLEGVVVEMESHRTRQWWSSHALRDSLRRVGSINQHPHGHRTAT